MIRILRQELTASTVRTAKHVVKSYKSSMSKNSFFTDKVKEVVRKIPKGSVLTYAVVAKKVGSPKAYRAVASVMANNYDLDVPCHRVVRTDGTLGEYNRGGIQAKAKILKAEGVSLKNLKVIF